MVFCIMEACGPMLGGLGEPSYVGLFLASDSYTCPGRILRTCLMIATKTGSPQFTTEVTFLKLAFKDLPIARQICSKPGLLVCSRTGIRMTLVLQMSFFKMGLRMVLLFGKSQKCLTRLCPGILKNSLPISKEEQKSLSRKSK